MNFSLFLLAGANAVQVMLKDNSWYCFEVATEAKTSLEIDYQITGISPEAVNFEVRQSGQVIGNKEGVRSATLEVSSVVNSQSTMDLCWQKTDRKSKKLDFAFVRNIAHSDDAADINTLDSLVDDLKLLMDELDTISRNIQKQKDLEQEHFDLAKNSAFR